MVRWIGELRRSHTLGVVRGVVYKCVDERTVKPHIRHTSPIILSISSISNVDSKTSFSTAALEALAAAAVGLGFTVVQSRGSSGMAAPEVVCEVS